MRKQDIRVGHSYRRGRAVRQVLELQPFRWRGVDTASVTFRVMETHGSPASKYCLGSEHHCSIQELASWAKEMIVEDANETRKREQRQQQQLLLQELDRALPGGAPWNCYFSTEATHYFKPGRTLHSGAYLEYEIEGQTWTAAIPTPTFYRAASPQETLLRALKGSRTASDTVESLLPGRPK